MAELLLRQLEVGAACEQRLDQRVEGLAFGLGDADQVRVERGKNADLGFAARFGHEQDSSACVTMGEQKTRLAERQLPAALVKGVSP